MAVKSFFHLLGWELKLMLLKRKDIFFMLVFMILISFLHQFQFGIKETIQDDFHLAVPYTIFIFILASIHCRDLYTEDLRDGSIESVLLSSWNLEWYYFTKFIATIISLMLTISLFLPVFLLIHPISIDFGLKFIFFIIISTPYLVSLMSVATIVSYQSRSGYLVYLLILFPFYTPIVIFSALNAVQLEENFFNLAIILSIVFSLTFPLFSCFLNSFVIRNIICK